MRVRSKTLFGRIDARGELKIHSDALTDFARLHKGAAVKIRVEIVPNEPTERLTNYFFGYVVKEMRQAFISVGNDFNEQETYDEIRKNCPVFFEEKRENGEWKRVEKEWEELDTAEAVEAIAWIQRWASTEMYWIIDDPK